MEENKKDQQLQVFENSEFGKLTAIEIGGEPWFVAREVAELLGYQDTKDAISRFCKGAVKRLLPTNGGNQSCSTIPERDLYRLIMRSRLPAAERFEEWVVGDVLPSIRKTGKYVPTPALPNFNDPVAAARAWADEVEAKQKALAIVEENRPKVEFFDQVTESSDAVGMAEAAQVLNMGIGRNKLFQFLRDEKILKENNMPMQTYIDAGYFRVIEQKYNKPSGEICISLKTVVYQKGLDFIRRRYMKAGM